MSSRGSIQLLIDPNVVHMEAARRPHSSPASSLCPRARLFGAGVVANEDEA